MEISKTTSKEIPYISVKACPICGEHPTLRQESLARPGGHGYPGHFDYTYFCEYCRALSGGTTHDIYQTAAEARNHAKELWNAEVDRVQTYMNRRRK